MVISRYLWICQGTDGYIKVLMVISRYRWLYQGIDGYITVSIVVSRYWWLHQGIDGYIKVSMITSTYRWLYHGIDDYINVSMIISRYPTTVGVRQGCLLSTTLFNIFLERIMTDALEDHEGTVSIGGRTVTNLHFAEDIDGLAGEEQELAKLAEHLDRASTAYGWRSVL